MLVRQLFWKSLPATRQKHRNSILRSLMGLPGHGDVVEGEVIEERFARDRSKLRGEVNQLSLNKVCEIQRSA